MSKLLFKFPLHPLHHILDCLLFYLDLFFGSKARCIYGGVCQPAMLSLTALALRSVCCHRFGNRLNPLALLLALPRCHCCLSSCCCDMITMTGFPLCPGFGLFGFLSSCYSSFNCCAGISFFLAFFFVALAAIRLRHSDSSSAFSF